MAIKSLGEKHVELVDPLLIEQVNALHVALACCERIERLRDAMNKSLLAAKVGIDGMQGAQFSLKWAEIENMLTAHRFVMQKHLSRLRAGKEEAA